MEQENPAEDEKQTPVTPPQSQEAPAKKTARPAPNLQRIWDIELPVTVTFGSTRRPLKEVLKLGPGEILELDKTAEDPVVMKVNKKIFARGQIVAVDGYYGIRITEIDSTAERIAHIGDHDGESN